MRSGNHLGLWKLKNRVHAFLLILASLLSVAYVVQHRLVTTALLGLLAIGFLHQYLMTFSHRLLFHETRGVTWKSPLLVFALRNWMVLFWPEGFECVRAAHDTTQRSQKYENKCLSESMLWFSPQYMKIDRTDFITGAYVAGHTSLQAIIYLAAAVSWGLISADTRLWVLLIFFVGPVVSRVQMYRGHSFLHSPKESLLGFKSQNFTSAPYDRQAYNMGLRGSRFLSKYALGFLGLGDHLHNNHHHDPNALCQSRGEYELDGAYVFFRAFRRIGLLKIEPSEVAVWRAKAPRA